MEVIVGLENVICEPNSCVTVGSFDGVHIGHQRIIRRMRGNGHRPVTVVTFSPHPQTVVRKDAIAPPQLTTFDERNEMFAHFQVDRLVIVKFDKQFAKISPEEFITDVLIERVGLKAIFVGPTHGFGKGRQGDVEMLAELGKKHDFTLDVVDPIKRDGGLVSSSRIRKLLATGDAHSAWRYLGQPYYFSGTIVKGDQRGKGLGFPTANIEPASEEKLKPPPGIYVTVAEVQGRRYPSVSHFGERPTFADADPAIETHIIGFDEDIYGEYLRVGLVERLRDIIAFNGVEDLVAQMFKDRDAASARLMQLGFGSDANFLNRRFGRLE
ncbi:bifunctional riboflavin kinase/FAD synthetase [Calditrichota bacterium]